MNRMPTFLIFEVCDRRGITRHGEELVRGARFAVKRTSSRRHIERWLKEKRIYQVTPKKWFCGVCGCSETDCPQCIIRTGQPCHWLDAEQTVCSACYGSEAA